ARTVARRSGPTRPAARDPLPRALVRPRQCPGAHGLARRVRADPRAAAVVPVRPRHGRPAGRARPPAPGGGLVPGQRLGAPGGAAGRSVLLDVTLFRVRSFANGNVTALTVSLGEFALILALPLWFQYALGMDALQAGLALLPLAVGSFLASGSVHRLSQRMTP